MRVLRKLEKFTMLGMGKVVWYASPSAYTRLITWYFRRRGMRIAGCPNYISGGARFDGTDYSLIELGEGCTVSTGVRVLTHDWSLTSAGRALGRIIPPSKPVGRTERVSIGAYAFVGAESMLMPGAVVGRGAIVGAGSVVRGEIPDYAIALGNPCSVVGDTREYVPRKLDEE